MPFRSSPSGADPLPVRLHQFVFAATMAFFIYDESPSLHFMVAAIACSTGAVIVVREAERVRVADASRV